MKIELYYLRVGINRPVLYGKSMKKTNRSRARKGTLKFNPNRDYIEQATDEFLEAGGQINYVQADEKSFQFSITLNEPICVDEFLLGD